MKLMLHSCDESLRDLTRGNASEAKEAGSILFKSTVQLVFHGLKSLVLARVLPEQSFWIVSKV